MVERFHLVTNVHQRNMHWDIQVYVIRKYDVPSSEDQAIIKSVDMMLQDRQGGRIHASIPKRLISTWLDRIKEFTMYNMREFVVVDKRTRVRATEVKWSLLFCIRTEVQEVEVPTFPLEAFRFRTIPELTASAVVSENELFDLVAEVVGKEDPRELVTSLGKETKRMATNIQDLEKNTIRCTLFGTCVDDLTPLMAQERTEPLIVVLQYFRINRWDGKTSVQSHFDISKVCCDLSLKEIQDFLNSMVDTRTTSSVRITQMQSQSSGQGIEELRRGQVEIKTIEEVWSLKEESFPWIAGTVASINTRKNGWYYKACESCPKKVDRKENNMWECTRYNKITSTFLYRYKIEIVVYDDTATLTLLLWDNEVADLVGVKAQTLLDSWEGNKDCYPDVLENLFEKRLLWKVSVKEKNLSGEDTVFRVMKICDDEDLVDRYYPKDETVDNKSDYNLAETGGSNEVDF
ncbi:hypothetical protein PIB30_118126 [Stylosanthes scabra]|uniref:Replication factor A C-terminal domain-containing protein n=1 Tax=Stylosanthes scabra TaxID=79078 RepID=A0ABU6Q6Q7_9FABA|nr:hypothetical protein [Stylosanthes scabra]